MRYYLMSDCGNTGESFKTLEELHVWYYDQMGEYPAYKVKGDMRNGRSFAVGSRYYKIEKKSVPSMMVA